MNFIRSYTSFFTQDRTFSTLQGIEIAPNFYIDTLKLSLAFSLVTKLVSYIARRFFPLWYANISEEKKKQLPSYVVSLLHHLVVTPVGWMYIYRDIVSLRNGATYIDYSYLVQFIGPFCAGYIVSDTVIFAIPDALRGKLEYLLHHAFALWLLQPFLFGSPKFACYYAHLLICETTGICLNSSWILRLMGLKDHAFVFFLEVSFAIGFFFLRIINLTLVFYTIAFSLGEESSNLGPVKWNLLFISLMQFYWFGKIATGIVGKIRNKVGSTSRKEITSSTDGDDNIKTNKKN